MLCRQAIVLRIELRIEHEVNRNFLEYRIFGWLVQTKQEEESAMSNVEIHKYVHLIKLSLEHGLTRCSENDLKNEIYSIYIELFIKFMRNRFSHNVGDIYDSVLLPHIPPL